MLINGRETIWSNLARSIRFGKIENRSVIDAIVGQDLLATIAIEDDWAVTDGKEIGNAKSIGKDGCTGDLHFTGTCGVVVSNAAGIQVFRRRSWRKSTESRIGRVRAPVEGGVHEDEIESAIRMTQQAIAAVVNDDVHFRISQEARDHGPLLDQAGRTQD